jgi:transglutaminase-like putative cysteine protease
MGAIVFIIATIAGIYWLISFYRSLSADLPPVGSRRRGVSLDYLRSTIPAQPTIVTSPILKRLPQISLDFAPIIAPTPSLDRSSEISANFDPIPSKTEESLLFRSLVLGMFAYSVICVDLAAGTHYGWVGIPFTTMGAVWSWYRRHYPKHWLNISVSVVSLAIVVGALVPILVRQLQIGIDLAAPSMRMSVSLELALGLIAVALQMGLSFHLYHRRLLGYCLVTSGLLIGVAAGLSQNLGFLILLSGFMTIAVPTLMLDYRSRLALKPIGIATLPTQGQLSYRHLPWKYLSQLAGISIGLGLILSIFLPNFHFPDLSFKPTGLDRLQTLAQKYHPPQIKPQPNSSPPISSPPPQPNPQAIASKLLGQPNNNNYPETIKRENLQLPPEITSQLQQFTQKILTTSPQPLNSDFDRAAYLAEYLKQHHQEDPQPSNPTNLPPIDPKLIQQLIAKCADAPQTCKLGGNKQDIPIVYTSMLRSIGIPARLKTGEQLAQIDPQTKMYPRPTGKAQSQAEVYFPNWGWLGLDSTPDRALLNLDNRQLAQLQEQSQQPPSATPTPQPTPNSPISSPAPNSTPEASSPPLDLPEWKPDPVILRKIAIALAIMGGIVWYLWYRHQQQQQLVNLPPIEQIYRSMLASLSKHSRSKLPTQTQLEYAQSINNTEHPQIAKVVWEISQSYTAWRYGKERIDIKQLTKKLQYLQHLQQLATNKQRQQWFACTKSALLNLRAKMSM